MSSYFRIGLTILWVEGVGLAFIIFLSLCGLHLSHSVFVTVMGGWSLFCWLFARFSSSLYLFFFYNTRRPLFEEDRRLKDCLGEVLRRAGGDKHFDVLIEEKMELNAFAIGLNRIVVSRGILEAMNDDDLKGIFAHETGHLRSRDYVTDAAFETACRLPGTIRLICSRLLKSRMVSIIRRAAASSRLFALVLCISLAGLLFIYRLVLPTLLFCVFLWILGPVERLFRWLLRLGSRFSEYKQDAYAHHLGYGRELRQALYKLTQAAPHPVNRWFILMNSNHPVIFNRIRKLEELEGLR